MTTPGRTPLPQAAETLLAGWPAPSKSALDWEDFASRTTQAAKDAGATAGRVPEDDALLAPPLPPEDGEGSLTTAAPVASAAEREEPGLLSIAQKVVAANTGASSKEIALAGLQAVDAERRDAPLAPPPRPPTRAEQEAQAVAGLMGKMPSPGRSSQPEPVRPVAVVRTAHLPVEASAHSEVPAARESRAKKPWAALTASGVALSLAAAFALYAGSRQAPADLAAQESPLAANAEKAAPAAVAPPVERAPIASAAAVPLEELAPAQPAENDTLSFSVKKEAAASKGLILEPKVLPAPAQAAKPEPVARSKKGRPLNDEMADAVGASPPPKAAAPAPREPESSRGALPDRPSVGDAQAAAGPALMKARMCLAGQETGSQAKLTFGSDGKVKNVVISGPAAGTPAESCLKSQLSSARVPPFSEKAFSFSLTVRPP